MSDSDGTTIGCEIDADVLDPVLARLAAIAHVEFREERWRGQGPHPSPGYWK